MEAAAYPPNPAIALMQESASLGTLAVAAETCVSCPLYERATQTVFGAGSPGARLMLVGEQPGDSEDKEGEPFVGPAGAMLDGVLASAEIPDSSVYLTNVVKHFKWKHGNPAKPRLHAKPNRGEVTACLPWLEAELDALDPAVVVTLGATATRALLGPDVRVTRDHGVPVAWMGRTVIATIHPAAVLRGGDNRDRLRRQLVADLSVARRLMEAAP